MWYDTVREPPPRKSPLETLFVLVYLRRAEQELMGTHALIQSLVMSIPSGTKIDPAIEAFQRYFNAMMPHLEKAAKKKDEAKEALLRLTKHPVKIGLKSLYKQRSAQWKQAAKTKIPRAKLIRPKIPGTS